MNKETVQARLTALQQGLAQQENQAQALQTAINAQNGAIVDCQHWLSVLEAEEQAKAAPAEAPAAPVATEPPK